MSGRIPPSAQFPGGFPPEEWIEKALGDLGVAEREAAVATPNLDAISYHCQQAIEKIMKAALVANGIEPPKLHDLTELQRRMQHAGIVWSWSMSELRLVSMAAVHARYPGYTISAADAADILRITRAAWVSLRGLV